MKRIPTLIAAVAMVNLGVAGIHAQQGPTSLQGPIKMTVSGTNVATTINLQSGTITDEVNFAGNGSLGPFTYRELHADALSPQSSNTCVAGTGLYVPTLAGGGVFRFQDGSLLAVGLTEGSLCIDVTTGAAHFNGTYKITGGTGRFKSASGALTLNSTVFVVLVSDSNAPALLTNAGEFAGQISGVVFGEEVQNERQ